MYNYKGNFSKAHRFMQSKAPTYIFALLFCVYATQVPTILSGTIMEITTNAGNRPR